MHDWFQKHEQYCTEVAGPWQTRQCDPSEYEAQAHELIQIADNLPPYHTNEDSWARTQAKILQNRAHYIRQAWAKQEAEKQAKKQADELFKQQLATWQANLQAWQASIQANLQQQATQATQHSTPPAPQEAYEEEANLKANAEITAEKQEQEPRQRPLYQATVEDDTEHGNSILDTKSILSSFSCLCTTSFSGDSAACLSDVLSAYQHALNLACQHTMFQAWHGPLLGYIRCMEGMEATGEG